MGSASLVFGLIFIGAGLVMTFFLVVMWSRDPYQFEWYVVPTMFLILCVPFFVPGTLLLIKYNSNKKNQTKGTQPAKAQITKTKDETQFWVCPNCGGDTQMKDGRQYCPSCKFYLST